MPDIDPIRCGDCQRSLAIPPAAKGGSPGSPETAAYCPRCGKCGPPLVDCPFCGSSVCCACGSIVELATDLGFG